MEAEIQLAKIGACDVVWCTDLKAGTPEQSVIPQIYMPIMARELKGTPTVRGSSSGPSAFK